jgi:hypothetical protein
MCIFDPDAEVRPDHKSFLGVNYRMALLEISTSFWKNFILEDILTSEPPLAQAQLRVMHALQLADPIDANNSSARASKSSPRSFFSWLIMPSWSNSATFNDTVY